MTIDLKVIACLEIKKKTTPETVPIPVPRLSNISLSLLPLPHP